jgi:hypothetical protein
MEERDRCYSFSSSPETTRVSFIKLVIEGPGQEYPKPASVYEEFDESARSERCV